MSPNLDATTRQRALQELATERFDVIVIGGGVTGAGIALDAASRGLRAALVEKSDLASGTSQYSSKLAHGGLRYLAKADFLVAWESVLERGHLMRTIAPHLARPMGYVVPLNGQTGRLMGALAETGIRLADVFRMAARTSGRVLPMPRRIDPQTTHLLAPALATDDLRGAILYYDGWLEDDARLVIDIARTAAAHGARIATRCRASDIAEDRLTLTDEVTGESFEARGVVVNATGVWADELEPSISVRPSRGSHVIVRSEVLGNPQAVFTAPVPGHFGRYLFAIPHPDGYTMIGLTDEEAEGVDPSAPPVLEEDETFLLETFSAALRRPLTKEDVIGRFAGLRPLVSSSTSAATADVSRRHLLLDEPGRPITIAGGKLTTYRRMAEDTVDAVIARLGEEPRECHTATIPLVGAARREVLEELDAPARYIRRYGTEAVRLVELAQEHPELDEPLSDTCPTTGVELLFGALYEGAMTVEDLLQRRTRASYDPSGRERGPEVAERVLELAAGALTV